MALGSVKPSGNHTLADLQVLATIMGKRFHFSTLESCTSFGSLNSTTRYDPCIIVQIISANIQYKVCVEDMDIDLNSTCLHYGCTPALTYLDCTFTLNTI